MIALRAKVSWIVCGHRLAVGEAFEVESERHAAGLLARGEAERMVDGGAPAHPAPTPAPVPAPLAQQSARKPRATKA